ncbi:MAG TPA: glucoamylase family protein [Polyangiaceae bacterium]
MTAAANSSVPAEARPPSTLEEAARTIAGAHLDLERANGHRASWGVSRLPGALERARRQLAASADEEAFKKAAEWFLDNYYVIRRVARQVVQELPRGFQRRLPLVASGPSSGLPRIDALARALVALGVELDAAVLRRFVDAYQEISPLTIAELWALPTMLRAATLRGLLASVEEVETDPGVATAGVERAVRALRLFGAIDWKTFFESVNRVEAVLRADPAHVYARMDFETCDSYRKAVEELAWWTARAEEDVAQLAVSLAREGVPAREVVGVGYFLLGEGRRILEGRLGFRPRGVERLRRLVRRWPNLVHLGLLSLCALIPLALEAWLLERGGVPAPVVLVAVLLTSLPVSAPAAVVAQGMLTRLLPPRILPKLDFSKGVPQDARTLVVIPTLLGSNEDVQAVVRQIELHYLSNPDPGLQFALLTDDVDAPREHGGATFFPGAARAIDELNARHGANGRGPFHLLHREPRWNPAEGCFMGWERKRGKLEELNRLLRGAGDTSFTRRVGDPDALRGIRFVITLDSDTQLPMGSAQRLVGLLAHPLNRAVFDPTTERVVSGYTIVQPRIETAPSAVRRTTFSRIFAGDVGLDIYTHASSDLYQDLFDAGIYVGKGIYDVDAFARSLAGRVPENALVSHDLFEGVHGRAALATDVVLFEGYPSHYAAFARRMHRWVRGDWQLVPWLFPRVPGPGGARLANPLRLVDRWKILDNLRRSLVAPASVLLLLAGWTWLPGRPLLWTLAALFLIVAPILPSVVEDRRRRRESLARGLLAITFVAHEAGIVVDAVARVAFRMCVSRRRLLQWTSAAHPAHRWAKRSQRALLWREMAVSPLLALGACALVAWTRPLALPAAAPVLALWLVAAEIARGVSRPVPARDRTLSEAHKHRMRLLARRTWLFFETFVGPNDQWLPIDNYQEAPNEQTAHRTSPTNIGMMLLATLAAYDLGYVGASELSLRLRRGFESMARLARYRGHLLNWYDTRSLEPLLPQYVSTVDSGNLAGCLLALKQACIDAARAPVVRPALWRGLVDSLDLLEEALASVPRAATEPLRSVMERMRVSASRACTAPDEAYRIVRGLDQETCPELERALLALVGTGAYRHETEVLRALRRSMERLRLQLQQMRSELETLLPWLALQDETAAKSLSLPGGLRLDQIDEAVGRLSAGLEGDESDPAGRLRAALQRGRKAARSLRDALLDLGERAEKEVAGMDFRLLFDRQRKLFRIGHNVTADRPDPNYYDLLASEARLASYLAVVKRDVPESHWYALGRPMTDAGGAPALLSWGGTMFEYLMPALLMRSHEGTLLSQTYEIVVDAQIAYGRKKGVPWGISESAYSRQDAQHTYQYRSFGVPGLGFKRGLEDDLVVAPYASLLALSVRPRAVVENVARFEAMGMMGAYGLFESVDFQSEHGRAGKSYAVVRSYMAHHQGMLLVALDNALNDEIMVARFHSDPLVETGELMLDERAPLDAPAEWPLADLPESSSAGASAPLEAPAPWSPEPGDAPQAFVLSNGRLTSLLTATGGGGLTWQGVALTRYEADPSRDADGLFLYVRDEQSHHVWRATSGDGRTTYALHKAEFHRREDGISIHVDVTVAPDDDVEVRQITLHNETSRARSLSLASVGEPALVPVADVGVHPAFARMFVESERVAGLDALLFHRRARSKGEESAILVHRLVREGPHVKPCGYETDRAALFGRGASNGAPRALASRSGSLRGRTGAVLDPVMSLVASVDLRPEGTVTLALVTAVAGTRAEALALAGRYGSLHAVRWAFRDADRESRRRLQRTGVEPALLPLVQRLYSALTLGDGSLRAPPDVIAAGSPCKRRLWGRGISGDEPILLVHVRVDEARSPVVREAVAAQRYLRSCGVRLDLVLMDDAASGYLTDPAGSLRSVLAEYEVDDLLNQHAGIFVLAADQLSKEERLLFDSTARVVLDTRDGSLAARLSRQADGRPRLPRFEPTLVSTTPPGPPPVVPPRLFDNGVGGFSADGRQYAISVGPGCPTPAPWCNVLANPDFGCMVSESSLSCTWSLNSGENRLTPWRNDPVLDTPSEVLYLRDEETGAIWSSTPRPAGGDAGTLVRHGAGYTSYSRESHGVEQELVVFVPPDAPLKVARLRLRNTSGRPRRLTATYYAEWVLGRLREEQRPYVAPEFDGARACLLARCTWNLEFGGRVAFLASERGVHGFTTDRAEFLGRGGYARPEALERWGLASRADAGVDPCAALQVHVDLAAGESVETHFILGQGRDREEALSLVDRYRDRAVVDGAWEATGAFWDGLLGSVRVKTPDAGMDLMLNRWLLYQTVSARLFGRTGFYQSSGAFGFRDQLQDVLALLHAAPERARAHILEAASHQFEEGDVLHWWHPPSGRGVRTRCSDDMAWLPFVVAEYVLATGDTAILSESAPFLSAEPLRGDERDRYAEFSTSKQRGSLLEHCRRALERAGTEGRHGLPLMGDGDWNDGMNRVGAQGKGESVWLAWFLVATMSRFASLCEAVNDRAEAGEWRSRAAALHARTDAVAWDGGWYLRAFHDDGSLVGSAKERECRIDSIAQSWSVLCGGAGETEGRAARAVQAADEGLVREAERLVLLLWPPFDHTPHDPGYIRDYPPGVRENGGQYTHAAAWLGWAYATLGEGASAERIFRLLNPIYHATTAEERDRYRVEPYVLAGDVYGAPPSVGRGGWTWYTGSAAWTWRLGVEAILGLRREHGQLRIDPCIPPTWKGFEAWLRIGAKQVHVVVDNPDAASRGVSRIVLDGVVLDSSLVRVAAGEPGTHEVRVTMGRARPLPRSASPEVGGRAVDAPSELDDAPR